ncbi:hypothetical protein DFQ28_009450 [Apophysomyces sp. BC1034]|nr:hypothetical protein DFQ28_009450 [Apophysomyces sp. BC1034]
MPKIQWRLSGPSARSYCELDPESDKRAAHAALQPLLGSCTCRQPPRGGAGNPRDEARPCKAHCGEEPAEHEECQRLVFASRRYELREERYKEQYHLRVQHVDRTDDLDRRERARRCREQRGQAKRACQCMHTAPGRHAERGQ